MTNIDDFCNKNPYREGLLHVIGQAIQLEFPDARYADAHTVRVAVLSATIAVAMGMPERYATAVGIAGSYHDVGKTDPKVEELVRTSRKLTELERGLVRQVHTDEGGKLIFSHLANYYDQETVWHVSAGAFLHHHSFSGAWVSEPARDCLFPNRQAPLYLVGKEIPLVPRVIAVADVFDAVCGNGNDKRPYQARVFTEQEALGELESRAGRDLDPDIVAIMVELVRVRLLCSTGQFLELGL